MKKNMRFFYSLVNLLIGLHLFYAFSWNLIQEMINNSIINQEIDSCECNPKRDSLALIDFYKATNIDWDISQPIENWEGVTLNSKKCVVKFNNEGGLKGSIPISFFRDLTCMEELILKEFGREGFEFSIPPEIGNMVYLKQLIIRAHFDATGILPLEIGNLTNLEILDLSRNNFFGTLPPTIGNLTKLRELYLQSNEFSGSIPSTFSSLKELEELWLFANNLNGKLPPELGELKKLTRMRLRSNEFSGKIPNEWAGMKSLEWLGISFNNISGTIPTSFGELKKLRVFNLSHNQLSPSVLQNINLNPLPYSSLNLSNNNLTGHIPLMFGESHQIPLSLDLSNNQLSGPLPEFIANSDVFLSIRNNNFTSLPLLTNVVPVNNNRLTFDDIIPNLSKLEPLSLYTPQKPFSFDTTFLFNPCDSPILDLQIDENITTNEYVWYKDGDSIMISNNNQLNLRNVFNSFEEYSGVYTCIVNNPGVPLLTLNSGEMLVELDTEYPTPDTINIKKTLCIGNSVNIKGKVFDCSTPQIVAPIPDSIFGCISMYNIQLNCTSCQTTDKLKIPTAFSPNGDGINETFIIPILIEQPDLQENNELLIYTHYGQLVYQKLGYENDWEGKKMTGEPLPIGTYYYIFKLGIEKPRNGIITIVR